MSYLKYGNQCKFKVYIMHSPHFSRKVRRISELFKTHGNCVSSNEEKNGEHENIWLEVTLRTSESGIGVQFAV